ncbi:kinase-like domain-containing protein [Mycena leptocephala]|nr:kinase-like domain-containing protein [Mycena leptocephala]
MENGHIYNYLRSNPAGINRLTLINVLVTRSGRAVPADFGLSSVFMDSKIPALSFSVHSGGTTRWQAPELLHGNRNSAASDVYAFACVCYEIFTGKIPFFEVREHAVVMHVVNGNLRRNYPASRTISGPSWKNVGELNRGNVLWPNRLLRGSAIRP